MARDRRTGAEPDPARGLDGDALRPVTTHRPSRSLSFVLPLVAVALVAALVKPWELSAPAGGAEPLPATSDVPRSAGPGGGSSPSSSPAPREGAGSASCADPQSWRTATIETWAGRQARVWSAADVGAGTPDDPDLPFEPVIAERVTAIGWCAPVAGPDRPPLTATARLFRLGPGGFEAMPYRRIEPTRPNALGELWAPIAARTDDRSAPAAEAWAPGRYVIELRAGRTWRRLIGLEIRSARLEPLPGPSGSAAGSPSPGPGTASPGSGPGQTAAP